MIEILQSLAIFTALLWTVVLLFLYIVLQAAGVLWLIGFIGGKPYLARVVADFKELWK